MANLTESGSYDANIYQLESSDQVQGGAGGISNRQAQQLANRTSWLKSKVDALFSLDGFVGDIKPWAGPYTTIRTNWCLMDGRYLRQTDFPALFTALGGSSSPYGVNLDGTGTFRIPKMVEGASPVQSGSSTYFNLGDGSLLLQGEKTHLLTTDEMPSHSHDNPTRDSTADYGSGYAAEFITYPGFNGVGKGPVLQSGVTGGGGRHNNMPPYVAMNWIIKLQ